MIKDNSKVRNISDEIKKLADESFRCLKVIALNDGRFSIEPDYLKLLEYKKVKPFQKLSAII